MTGWWFNPAGTPVDLSNKTGEVRLEEGFTYF
jgi:hypothetical protein